MSKRDKEQLELFEVGAGAGQGPYELPRGWCWTTLGAITSVTGGVTKNAAKSGGRSLPYLRVANVYADELRLDDVHEILVSDAELQRTLLQRGDLLIVEGNGSIEQIGRVAIWDGSIEPCVHQNHLIKARSSDPAWSRWFLYWLLSSEGRSAIVRVSSSTSGLHTLSLSKVESLPLPLCPPRERDEIVGVLETQFSRLDAAKAGLRRVQANLKRYRAAVLQAAVEGRLVPTEAELARREGRDYEPASALLDRILAERRRRWEEAELARLTVRGKPPQNDTWKAKYQEPAAPDTTNLPPLPDGWCWATIDQLARDEQYSLTDGPFGSNLKTEHYTDTGPRVIRLQNIGDASFTDEHAYISEEHYNRLVKHAVFPGDIVIASLGTELPRACEVPDWLGPAIVKADCIRFSPDPSLASTAYLTYALNAHPTRRRTMSLVHGIGRPRIGLTLLREVPIPLPPFSEQKRIVIEIERLISIANETQLAIDADIARIQRLRQAILKQAFEGKLVAQDPSDEPASVLLARIRGEHGALAPSTTTSFRGASSAGRAKPARKRARP